MDHATRLCTGKENEERQVPNIALILRIVSAGDFLRAGRRFLVDSCHSIRAIEFPSNHLLECDA
jgi:hypothetical protein